MGKIQIETCEIEGLKVITPVIFGDESQAGESRGERNQIRPADR